MREMEVFATWAQGEAGGGCIESENVELSLQERGRRNASLTVTVLRVRLTCD